MFDRKTKVGGARPVSDPGPKQDRNGPPMCELLEPRRLMAGQQSIVNGGFDAGVQNWSRNGDFYADTTLSNYRTGPGYAAGGTARDGTAKNNANGFIEQQFAIPANATSAKATWWYYITTKETSTSKAYDFLNVQVVDRNGNVLATVASYSNRNKTSGYTQGSADLSRYAGQTIKLRFAATSDSTLPTTFRIDDVGVALTVPDAPKPPAAPTNLTASATSSTQINISWVDNSNNETGHLLERKTGSGSYVQIASLAPNATAYQDSGLSPNTAYSYRVLAFNGAGNSNYSNVSTATTKSGTTSGTAAIAMASGFYYPLPTATPSDTNWLAQNEAYESGKVHFGSDLPTSIGTKVFSVAAGKVLARKDDGFGNEVVFVLHQGNSGPFVAVYGHIRSSVNVGDTPAAGQPIGTVADFNGDNVPTNDHLHFGISPGSTPPPSDGINFGWGRANVSWYQSYGTNGFVAPISYLRNHSPASTSTTTSSTAPNAPTGFRFTQTGSGQGVLSWSDTSDNELGFQLQWWDGSGWSTWYTAEQNTTSLGVGLSTGYSYRLRVLSFNSSGSSASSEITVRV